jgi:hypothetical protein
VIDLDARQGNVPFILGWLMSDTARRVMREKIAPAASCPLTDPGATNPCGYGRVLALLAPSTPPH